MSQTIQCPTCSKKFKLPDRPPATFTCTGPNCGTVMDLSGFREAPAAASPAAAAASPAAAAASDRALTRSSSRPGAGRSSTSSRSGASRSGSRSGRERGNEDAEEGGGRAPPPKSNALLIGSLIGLVVIGGILWLVLKKKDVPAKPPVAAAPVPDASGPAMGAAVAVEPTPEPEPAMDEQPKYVNPSKVQFHPVEHNKDATPDERTKIDQLVQSAIFENNGRDSQLAGDELVALDIKAAPRIINVFSTVKMGVGFEDRMGKIQSALADGLLRRIDGHIERKLKQRGYALKGQSDPAVVERVARIWISWWDSETYKDRQKPWNEKIDANPDDAVGGMDDAPAKKPTDAADGK